MDKTIQRILLFVYLLINILFIEKYASRVTDFHLCLSLGYVLIAILSIYLIGRKINSCAHATQWEIAIGLVLLCAGVLLQYAIDPYSLRVDRWSAIHNFLVNMMQGEYPYGASTHLGGYGSPFPVWQIFHIPYFLLGNVGLSIFVVVVAFVATIHYFHSNKVALMTILLLGISPAFWYEVVVRSDLITNMLLVAILVEWLVHKRVLLSRFPLALGVLSGLVLSTRLIAIIPLCVLYGYEFLHIGWKKQSIFILSTVATFALTFLPFILWNGSTLLFFEYSPFVLQTRQGSVFVLLVFAVIAIASTLICKGQTRYVFATTGLLLNLLVVMSFVEKMWEQDLWNGLFSSAFDITYLSTSLPFYIAHLSCSIVDLKKV